MNTTLSSKEYKNDFVSSFDGDNSGSIRPRQTPGVLYSKAPPTPVKKPELLAWSEDLAKELGIEKPDEIDDINILGGNLVTSSMQPYAACYAGHQFGNWAGQLGDGRAITLGEWETPDHQIRELQLKGAGPTAYSRRADGRAVLRSSVREYLMSEAMYYLGVPTTRALSLITTGEQIMRDMFYNGNPQFEPGAIVMRVSPSFLRFGNFEMLAARKEYANLKKLIDWTIERFYPHIEGDDKILQWFKEVVSKTAVLMVEWQRVGFVHGVMNTDNMSILGLTIDYGPFSFIDNYDPDFTPNTTDLPGKRYAFGRQPAVAKWNLGCLAGAISTILPEADKLVEALDVYDDVYRENFYVMMSNKLGLDNAGEADAGLISNFEKTLTLLKPDMTIFYQRLIDLPADLENPVDIVSHFDDSYYDAPSPLESKALTDLMHAYSRRIKLNNCSPEDAKKRMRENNPRFILRNYLLHQGIEELERSENQLFLKLMNAIKDPYSSKNDEFFARRPGWATQKAGCSMLSCSS